MKLKVKFEQTEQTFKAEFGETYRVSDGGYDRGYADGETAGYSNGYTEGETKGKAEGKAEGIEEGYADGKADGITEGIEQGKQAEWSAFWDAYQQNGERRIYQQAFKENVGWNSVTFSPKYDIITEAEPMQIFYKCGNIGDLSAILKRNNVVLDLSNATELNGTFYNSGITKLPVLNVSKCESFISVFGSNYLIEIEGLHGILETATFNAACFNGINLRTIGEITGTIGTSIVFDSRNMDADTAKRILAALKNYVGTDKEGAYQMKFHNNTWVTLEASGSAPNGGAWKDYVIYSLGWSV